MNILHHKSWHVRNKDNIKRVRRDEAKAAEHEKEKQKKVAVAESEARINFLRAKSSNDSQLITYDHFQNQNHVNLFEKEEKGLNITEKNKEVEEEKKKEQEVYEKKIGALKYLVDDELDIKNQPWYKTVGIRNVKKEDDVEIDLKHKRYLDPLKSIEELTGETERKKLKKKHKKEKQKEKDKDKNRTKSIDELRAERIKREAEEKIKAQRLISGEITKPNEPKIEADDRKRKYNNQFNPDFSKF
ncbi:leukocyte receptor cluster member 1 [Brachionus plicatilis]|uniref:Leukocyte receptor cluster member 1 n=1 Tax=Brachionus plicatilis TaxID=10195 RepID=A0A3M7Q0R7_BRAPC|nr:leukocyte receptor cluster member 1 [Brachionus plicatilis]